MAGARRSLITIEIIPQTLRGADKPAMNSGIMSRLKCFDACFYEKAMRNIKENGKRVPSGILKRDYIFTFYNSLVCILPWCLTDYVFLFISSSYRILDKTYTYSVHR